MGEQIELPGLEGANPLAFLAAIGLLNVGERMGVALRVAWTRTVAPVAVVESDLTLDEIVDVVIDDARKWAMSILLTYPEGAPIPDVKLPPAELRSFIEACAAADDGGRSEQLVAALVAEGSLDRNGAAKPSDLHFTAGQQRFIAMARQLCGAVDARRVREALVGPWPYDSELPSFKWDVSDDAVYALSAFNPSSAKKLTVPGAEWLALMGVASLPVFAGSGKTLTTACGGTWKRGTFTWPLWAALSSAGGARSVVAAAVAERRAARLRGWSVFRLQRSAIRRSDQGGYGSFGPPEVVWEAGAEGPSGG